MAPKHSLSIKSQRTQMQTVFLFIIYQMIVDIRTNVLTSKKHFGDNFTHFIFIHLILFD